MAVVSLSYNSFNLNDSVHITGKLQDAHSHERRLSVFNLAKAPGGVITDSVYGTKTIPVVGRIIGSSQSDLDSRIDTFHAAMAVQDKNLDIGYAGGTRRYVCTPARHAVNRLERSINTAEYEIEFLATEYGKDTSTTTLVNAQTHTTASNTRSLTVGGSAPEQFLRTQITVTAATGLTGKTISVENDTTGELISVTRNWTVSDVLEIDVLNKTVKVNGSPVEFSGPFATYSPGTHDMIVTNDFTTRTLTQTVDYVKRYL